jgi:hypothetical protein
MSFLEPPPEGSESKPSKRTLEPVIIIKHLVNISCQVNMNADALFMMYPDYPDKVLRPNSRPSSGLV